MELNNVGRIGFLNENAPDWVDNERINFVVDFLRPISKKIKSINYSSSSYGIKHGVERAIGMYISNGELIIAMLKLGFKYKRPPGNAGVNCYFNISSHSLKKIDEWNKKQ